jgi:hypothetical protein
LTVGREYVVLAISANEEDAYGTQFMLLDDVGSGAGWFAANGFDLTSDLVPSNWSLRVGVSQTGVEGVVSALLVGSKSWLRPGYFYERTHEDPEIAEAAQLDFDRELEIILSESA